MKPCRLIRPEEHDSFIITRQKVVRRGLLRRVFGVVWKLITWAFVLAPGLLIVAYGVGGIRNQKLVGVVRYKTTSYGDDAVGWGWLFTAIGFWALGQCCALKTGRAGFKLIGWILAIGTGGIGVWVLLRRFF